MVNLVRLGSLAANPGHFIITQRNANEGIYVTPNRIISLNPEDTARVANESTRILESVGLLGIHRSNNKSQEDRYLCFVDTYSLATTLNQVSVFNLGGVTFFKINRECGEAPEIADLTKLFACGSFFFCYSSTRHKFDITLNQAAFGSKHETNYDFLWNGEMLGLLQLAGVDYLQWTADVIGGFFSSKTVYSGTLRAQVCLISRMNRRRAGTRFSVRGVDDEGAVANHVETEQVTILSDGRCFSFVLLRGSVPLFWEQTGTQVGSHKVTLSREMEATFPAFLRHLHKLRADYGEIFVLNLLGTSSGEFTLTYHLQEHIKTAKGLCKYFNFDYHGVWKNAGERERAWGRLVEELGPFLGGSLFGGAAGLQFGVVRVNCIDCLDRTNSMQKALSLEAFKRTLCKMGIELRETASLKFEEALQALWESNGHAVSKLYAGTDSLNFQKSKATNVLRTAERVIQSSMFDSRKNAAISFLLRNSTSTLSNYGIQSHIGSLVGSQILKCPTHFIDAINRQSDGFCRRHKLRVFVGTWNVNGMSNYQSIVCKGDIGLWLTEAQAEARRTGVGFCQGEEGDNDIYAIGFEEMVDLTAANIISGGGHSKRHYWADEIKKKLSERDEFCLVTSLQLVGVCLFVFVRGSLLGAVREVMSGSVKTGVDGTVGNKGGVAIRLRLHNTTLCFVCSHLAAGQSNVAERNSNMNEILRKMTFGSQTPAQLSINSHDFVFWCGDLNYRIDLPRETVLSDIASRNWPELLSRDQLRQQMVQGQIFKHYVEGPINFAPTYKYDLYVSDYDTSDKCRVPAWTDRILWMSRGALADPSLQGRLLYYSRAELVTSDHRPVGAIIEIEAEEVIGASLEETAILSLNQLPPFDGSIVVSPYSPHLSELYHSHFSAIGTIQDFIPLGDRLIVGYADPLALASIHKLRGTSINRIRTDIKLPLVENWKRCVLSFCGIGGVAQELMELSVSPPLRPNRSIRSPYRNLYNLGDPGAPPT